MGKEEILSYVMNSPENTNPNVLGSMLDGMGGNNLNRIQLVTGTADNPWGTIDTSALFTAMSNKEATVYAHLSIQQNTRDAILTIIPEETEGWFAFDSTTMQLNSSTASVSVYSIGWDLNGELSYCDYVSGDGNYTDMMSYANQILTEFTIVWHPLSSQ